jgi:hypothetical protein
VAYIQTYFHAKFYIFLRSLSIYLKFIPTCLENQIEKEFQLEKGVSGHFTPRRPTSTMPRPVSTREPGLPPITAPLTLTTGTHLSGLLPPNPPRPRACWRCCRDSYCCIIHPLPPLCHSVAHLCAYLLEPSCPISCRRYVASCHCATVAHLRRCARDACAKCPTTRPCAASLLPSPLLAPQAGFIYASSCLASHRIGAMRWQAHAHRLATFPVPPCPAQHPTPAYRQIVPSRALHAVHGSIAPR